MAQGSIIADGEYRLTTFVEGDGAILGKHQVVIKATRIAGSPSPKSVAEELRVGGGGGGVAEGGSLEWIVPEQYSDRETSPLTAVVKAGGNQINFEIPSK